jgi:hypothetical protein
VARHDLVFLSPPSDPQQYGIPLGNGEIGVLAWCEDTKLILAVNKSDLWDDAASGAFDGREEKGTTLRHACRCIIDFGHPVFDIFYLSDFECRLSLADGCMRMKLKGPFGNIGIEAFVVYDADVMCMRVETDMNEGFPVTVSMERYGSRSFGRWYVHIVRDPAIGLGGTDSWVSDKGAFLSQRLTSGNFACAFRADAGSGEARLSRKHAHGTEAAIRGEKKKSFDIYLTVTSPKADAGKEALEQEASLTLEKARSTGYDKLLVSHTEKWKAFWLRSYMDCGDDYLNNLWHLMMYYACSSQRGRYPGRFIHGLWGWSRDVQQWISYFHWNQQELYWALNAAGHHELCDSYLRYRYNSLPMCREDARSMLGVEGALLSDVADRKGHNSSGEKHNYTPIAEAALDFWRQYRFTGDKDFLREKALPYMREAAAFITSMLEKKEDGLYHAKPGTAYEGWIMVTDGAAMLGCAGSLLKALIEGIEEAGYEADAAKWKEILEHLAPLPVMEADESLISAGPDAQMCGGAFAGKRVGSNEFIACGIGVEDGKPKPARFPVENAGHGGTRGEAAPRTTREWVRLMNRGRGPAEPERTVYGKTLGVTDGIFPTAAYAPVFPSGWIGLKDKGSRLYDAAVNTVLACAPDCMGWDTLSIAMCRLGLGEEAARLLHDYPGRWQFYQNGFGHYGTSEVMLFDAFARFRVMEVGDVNSDERFCIPAWPFRHMGLESLGVIAATINESLLQSCDGVIRVAPAVRSGQRACFTLHAAGGFVVSAQIEAGKPVFVSIKSLRGGRCVFQNPWTEALMEIDMAAGQNLMVLPPDGVFPERTAEKPEQNKQPKIKIGSDSGTASLGLGRMY